MKYFFQRIFNWYFSKGALPYWTILILDLLVCYLAGLFVMWMYYHQALALGNIIIVSRTLLIYLVFNVISFRLFHTYAGIIRYSSFADMRRIGLSMFCACVMALLAHYPINWWLPGRFIHLEGRQIIAIYAIATVAIWALRVLIKSVYEVSLDSANTQNVLIYGTNSGGIGLAKSLRTEKPARFNLKGFISNDINFTHRLLMGEKVYRSDVKLLHVIKKLNIGTVLISPLQNNAFRADVVLQDMLIENSVHILMASGEKVWTADDHFDVSALQKISVEDLLPRDPIHINMQAIRYALQGKRILISGSAGSIGHEIVRQVAACTPETMVLIDTAETPQNDLRLEMAELFPNVDVHIVVGSITHRQHMEMLFERYRPQVVFHAAAYKHVPMMEENPSESILNNVKGTKVLADLAVKYNVQKFVMLSTDKAVNPTNVMGASKRICEIYVQSLDKKVKQRQMMTTEGEAATTQFITTRFGNVLASNGSVIPLFERQIASGGPVTVTHPEITRFFMLIPEACRLVLEAGTHGEGGEIFVFDMGQPVKVVDLAKRMIQLSGKKDIEIQFIGLREGEKLYEEVLNDEETTKPSFHEKIRIASVREYDYDEMNQRIEQLMELAQTYDNMKIVAAMKALVPEYISQNSVYTQLDKKDE